MDLMAKIGGRVTGQSRGVWGDGDWSYMAILIGSKALRDGEVGRGYPSPADVWMYVMSHAIK